MRLWDGFLAVGDDDEKYRFICFCTYMFWCGVCIIAGCALIGMVYRSLLVSWEGLVTEVSLFLCDFGVGRHGQIKHLNETVLSVAEDLTSSSF